MDYKLLLRRFFAFLIDYGILFCVTAYIMYWGPGSNPEYLLYPSIKIIYAPALYWALGWTAIYCLFKDCLFGRRSLGKLIFGLDIQSSKTGKKASVGSLILRNIPYVIVQLEGIFVLANNGQRIGDMLAKTQVVRRTKKEP